MKNLLNDEISISTKGYFGEALRLYQNGDLDNSMSYVHKNLKTNTGHIDSMQLLMLINHQKQFYDESLRIANKIIKINPKQKDIYKNKGKILKALKQYEGAIESYRKGITIEPNDLELYVLLADMLIMLERNDDAEELYIALAKNNLDDSKILSACGAKLLNLKKYNGALELFRKSLELQVAPEIYNDMGVALDSLNRYEDAIEQYDKAILIGGDSIVYRNKGVSLEHLERYDDAIKCYDNAIKANTNDYEAMAGKGLCLYKTMRPKEAIECYDSALKINPENVMANWNKSLALLTIGKIADGFKLYEYRWKWDNFPSPKRNFTQPLWLGHESIEGKRILIHTEQGLGDTIQFCRYIEMVAGLGAEVIFEIEKPLVKLLEQLDGVHKFVLKGEVLPDFDLHCPLMSLPLAFGTTIDTIPARKSYLRADPEKTLKWRKLLKSFDTVKVGLVWSGNSAHANDKIRSIPLEKIIKHFPSHIEYICLQKEIRKEDEVILKNNFNIHFFGDFLNDFSDTAALCEIVDIVISVDTSVAHLAASLGKPTCILLTKLPDWRWMLNTKTSPWYPTVGLFRQTEDGCWDECLEEIWK